MTNLTGPRRVGAWPRWRPRAAEMSFGRKEAQEIASRCCTLRRAYRRADAFGRSPKHFMRIFAAKRIGPKNRILHRGHRERGASQSILPQITQMPQITIPREWFYLRSSASSAVKKSVFVFLRVLCGKNSGSVLSVPSCKIECLGLIRVHSCPFVVKLPSLLRRGFRRRQGYGGQDGGQVAGRCRRPLRPSQLGPAERSRAVRPITNN